MRLIKCRKCGATICTDEAFQERMLDAIAECHKQARKDRKNAGSYLHEASTYKKILNQYLHRTAEYDSELRRDKNVISVLVHFLLDNGFATEEKIAELRIKGEERAAARDREDAKVIEELYGQAKNPLFNNTKADPTARKAMKGV